MTGMDWSPSTPFGIGEQLLICTRLMVSEQLTGKGLLGAAPVEVDEVTHRLLNKVLPMINSNLSIPPSVTLDQVYGNFKQNYAAHRNIERALEAAGA